MKRAPLSCVYDVKLSLDFQRGHVYFKDNFIPNSEFLNMGGTASRDGDEHEIYTSGWQEGEMIFW